MTATDDGIGFIGTPSVFTTAGAVVNIETGEHLGSIQEWVMDPTLTAPISDRTQPLHTTAPAGKRLTVHLDIGQQSSLAAAPFVAEFDHARRIEIRGMLHLEGEALVMMDIDAQCHAHGTQALLPMPYAILFEGTEIIEIGRLYTFVPRAYPFDYPARKQDAGAGKPLGRPCAEPLPTTGTVRNRDTSAFSSTAAQHTVSRTT